MGAADAVPPAEIAAVHPDLAAEWPETLTLEVLGPLLTRSIWSGSLAAVADALLSLEPTAIAADARALVTDAAAACAAIAAANGAEQDRMLDVLRSAGVAAIGAPAGPGAQNRRLVLDVTADDLPAAVTAAVADGYLDLDPARAGPPKDLVKADATGTRMTLRAPSSLVTRIGRRLRRIGRPDPGPYLATPAELIPLLLDSAGVTSEDVVMDLGCGDGRIVIEAARRHGCRALGVELHPDLAALARRRASAAGLADLVTIRQGDAAAADVAGVTVVLAFLPMRLLESMLPPLLDRLAPGARVAVHEQAPLAGRLRPDCSQPIIGPASVTVAHVWSVR